jgi:hypothetical protein
MKLKTKYKNVRTKPLSNLPWTTYRVIESLVCNCLEKLSPYTESTKDTKFGQREAPYSKSCSQVEWCPQYKQNLSEYLKTLMIKENGLVFPNLPVFHICHMPGTRLLLGSTGTTSSAPSILLLRIAQNPRFKKIIKFWLSYLELNLGKTNNIYKPQLELNRKKYKVTNSESENLS